MAQGMSNSASCREVGINRRTANRWRYGRKIVDRAGNVRVYLLITDVRESDTVSERFLSEDGRIVIADLLHAKKSVRAIERETGRDPAMISRKVRRKRDPRTGKYHPFQAQRPYAAPARRKGRCGAIWS
ncbi:helix-turn-helix domain-containing protein [Streptomyces sp. NPDC001642]|uniref:helix-turn-helix domain-containing protein n=1 Tax=Streptomyces sp. NPDC001642 TaxID=3154392 RepID=UPI00331DC0FC